MLKKIKKLIFRPLNRMSGHAKRKYIVFLNIIIFILLNYHVVAQEEQKHKLKTIVIDPGHGGKDPGAIGKTSVEKKLTLDIAKKLGAYIQKNVQDVEVIFTRTKDEYVELNKRAEIANSNKADLFISIHVNTNKNKNMKGSMTFVMGLNKKDENLEIALQENSGIYNENEYKNGSGSFTSGSPEDYITMNLIQKTFLEEGLLLASKIQEQLCNKAGRVDKGVRQAGFIVLWNTTMPSVLVETGFISNPEEEKFLESDKGQSIIATAIYSAFLDYKNELEGQNEEPVNRIATKDKNKQTKKSIVFKVQIKTSPKKLSSSSINFKDIEGIEEYTENNKFKYTTGNTSSYSEIVKILNETRKKIPDAFVVAFKDGYRIPVKEALGEVKSGIK